MTKLNPNHRVREEEFDIKLFFMLFNHLKRTIR